MKKKKLIKKINELKTSRIDMRDTYIGQGNYGVAATVDGYIGGLNAVLNLFEEEDKKPIFDWPEMPNVIQWAWVDEGQVRGANCKPKKLNEGYSVRHYVRNSTVVTATLPFSLLLHPTDKWQDSLEQRPSKDN